MNMTNCKQCIHYELCKVNHHNGKPFKNDGGISFFSEWEPNKNFKHCGYAEMKNRIVNDTMITDVIDTNDLEECVLIVSALETLNYYNYNFISSYFKNREKGAKETIDELYRQIGKKYCENIRSQKIEAKLKELNENVHRTY